MNPMRINAPPRQTSTQEATRSFGTSALFDMYEVVPHMRHESTAAIVSLKIYGRTDSDPGS